MNTILEKAFEQARAIPAEDQEAVGIELLAILEKREVLRALDESEAEGGELPADKVFQQMRRHLTR